MDVLQKCYTTTIRPFRDSDYTEEIRWYFVPDEDRTPPLLNGSRFGNGLYAHEEYPWLGPGQVEDAPVQIAKSVVPYIPPLTEPAGPLDWFEHGAPWSAAGTLARRIDGLPLPCAGGIFGILIGGSGFFVSDIAGLVLGGNGTFSSPYVGGNGGSEWDGAAVLVVTVGHGGNEWDGAAWPGLVVGDGGNEWNGSVFPGAAAGDGGNEWNGTARITALAGDGGNEFNGATWPGLVVGDGGNEFNGTAGPGLVVGDGGNEFNGTAGPLAQIAAGGNEWNGQAPLRFFLGDGGNEWDGQAPLRFVLGDGGNEWDGAAGLVVSVGHGGNEWNGAAKLLPKIGDGGNEWNGEVTPTGGTTPTSTCVGAPVIAFNTNYSSSITGAGQKWYRLPTVANGTWYLKATFAGGVAPVARGEGGTCGVSLSAFIVQAITGCTSQFCTPATPQQFLVVQNNGGTLTYTVRFGAGACPP